MSETKVLEHMSRQHGLVTREQVLAAGMSDKQIRVRVKAGHWVRVAYGVYRHGSAPTTLVSRLLGVCWAHGALASHRSAAALHGIDGFRLDRIEVVVPHGRARPINGAKLHQSTQMDLSRPVDCDGVPTTGLARTLLDVAAVVSRKRLDQAIDSVLRDGRLRTSDLYRVLVSHARRGRDGCAAFRESLEDRHGDPVPLSVWSRMVADLLVESGLDRPAVEHRVHSPRGGFVAQVDLAYPDCRVAIELDSRRWHLNRVSFDKDPERRNRLTIAGWTVLNFTWSHYVGDPRALCATVKEACRQSHSPKLMTGPPSQGQFPHQFRRGAAPATKLVTSAPSQG